MRHGAGSQLDDDAQELEGEDVVALCSAEDASAFSVGQAVTFAVHVPWYRRALGWFARVVLRRKPPEPLRVAEVDHEAGVITLE